VPPKRRIIPALPQFASKFRIWKTTKAAPWIAGGSDSVDGHHYVRGAGHVARRAAAAGTTSGVPRRPGLRSPCCLSEQIGGCVGSFCFRRNNEEIAAALAKLPGLRVVGRSSAFRFKDEGRDLRVAGRSLNAPYVLDGSVEGSATAYGSRRNLSTRMTDVVVWTATYDREFTDILGVQTEIARAIADALQVAARIAAEQSIGRRQDRREYVRVVSARKKCCCGEGIRLVTVWSLP
jgi:hypothetical protein